MSIATLAAPRFTQPEALGPVARSVLAFVVANVAPDWAVELHRDPLGKGSIVILPADADDTVAPTLIIHADNDAYHVDEWRGDDWCKLGEYRAWGDVLQAIRMKLIWETPVSPTLH